jgi:hypothetical protein
MKTDDKNIKQERLEAQLAKISTNAIQDKLGFKPSTIKSAVTKDMIAQYQIEMMKPIEINGIKYKYHPSNLDFDKEEYEPLHVILSEAQIRQARQQQQGIARTMRDSQRKIEEYNTNMDVLRRNYDLALAQLRNSPVYSSVYKQLGFATRPKDEEEINQKFEEIINRLARLRAEQIDKYNEGEALIEEINQTIQENDRNISENKAEQARVDRVNKARLKSFEDDLNLLNRGRFNITQGPTESDDDYLLRLRETGQATASEEDMEKASAKYNRDKLRELMLELIRDTAKISNTVNFLTNEEVFAINQLFGQIKKSFLETFGFNNTSITEGNIVELLRRNITSIIGDVNEGKKEKVEEGKTELEEPTIVEGEAKALSLFDDLNKLGRDNLVAYYRFIKGLDPLTDTTGYPRSKADMLKKLIADNLVADRATSGQPRGEPPPKATIESAFTRPKSSPLQILKKRLEEKLPQYEPVIKEKITRAQEAVDAGNEPARKPLEEFKLIEKLILDVRKSKSVDELYTALDAINLLDTALLDSLPDIYPRTQTGFGLKPITHDIPNLIDFGRIKISPRKLYYNNTLAIKHKSGNSLNGLPNVKVSDKFVSIIMNLLKGQNPSLKDFNQLELNEKSIYDSLIYIAGLQKQVDNNFNDTKQQLKKRLELVEGEITAGNNNPALKKELHALLGTMSGSGMIGYADAKRYYHSVTGLKSPRKRN